MNDNEIRFNKLFETGSGKSNGRYRIEEFASMDQHAWTLLIQGLQQFTTESSSSLNEEMFVDFRRGMDLNAFAAKDPKSNKYFIAINYGTIMRLFAIFQTLFAETNIFPLDAPPNRISAVDLQMLARGPLEAVVLHQSLPQNPSRRAMADFCFSLAIEYIYLHEFAHIVRGHVGRAYDTTKSWVALGETADLGSTKLSNDERQAMELDADLHSALWCLSFYINRTSPVLWMPFWEEKPAGLPREFLAKTLMFVSGIMIHVLAGIGNDLVYFDRLNHPHNEVRFNAIYNIILNWMAVGDQEDLLSNNWFKEAIEAIVVSCDNNLPWSVFPTSFAPNNKTRKVLSKSNEILSNIARFEPIWSNHQLTSFTKI